MKKHPKILYITYDGLSDALGQSQVLNYLSRLSELGNHIHILSFEKAENLEKQLPIIQPIIDQSGLNWHKLVYHKSPPIFSTLWDIHKGNKKIKALHSKHNFDIIHCRAYIPAMMGLKLKRESGAKMIFDMRGWWADEKKDSGNWDELPFRPIYNYFKKREKEFFSESDFTVSLTEAGKEKIQNEFGVPGHKVGVIPTCVDFSIFKTFDPSIRDRIRKELGIRQEAKVFVYSGSIGGNYDLQKLLHVFNCFKKIYPEHHLLILSKYVVTNEVTDQIHAAGIMDYTIKNLSYREVSDYLIAGDIGLIFYKDAFSNIGRSPTKLGEYWASGVPVISFNGIGDLQYLFNKYPRGGFLLDEEMTDFNLKMKSVNWDMKEQLRKDAFEYFSLERGIDFYNNIYQKLNYK